MSTPIIFDILHMFLKLAKPLPIINHEYHGSGVPLAGIMLASKQSTSKVMYTFFFE